MVDSYQESEALSYRWLGGKNLPGAETGYPYSSSIAELFSMVVKTQKNRIIDQSGDICFGHLD